MRETPSLACERVGCHLVAVMSVLAVMATGAHVLSYRGARAGGTGTPKQVAAADAERSIVAASAARGERRAACARPGGGIVLAFAVGLGAGQVHRRRRRTARRGRRARRGAPPPPRRAGAAAAAPPPPEPARARRARGARVAAAAPPPPRPSRAAARAAPAPSRASSRRRRRAGAAEPPPPADAPSRSPFGRDAAVADAHAAGAEAPEVPRPQDVDAPLSEAPRRRRSSPGRRSAAPARRAPEPPASPRRRAQAPPARRRSPRPPAGSPASSRGPRRRPRCGRARSTGRRATASPTSARWPSPPGAGKRRQIGESPAGAVDADERPRAADARTLASASAPLIGALEAAGWERIGPGGPWYAQRFLWRGRASPSRRGPGRGAGRRAACQARLTPRSRQGFVKPRLPVLGQCFHAASPPRPPPPSWSSPLPPPPPRRPPPARARRR